jgi:hypothetical protein
MWQVLLGIYLVLTVLSAVVLWSALVLAKKSDRNAESRLQSMTGATAGGEREPISEFTPYAR